MCYSHIHQNIIQLMVTRFSNTFNPKWNTFKLMFYGKRFAISLIILRYITTGDPHIALLNIRRSQELLLLRSHY